MYTISQLARAAGVNVETVRYYERRGLIEQPDKPAEGYRRYPETTLDRIRFIKRAQELGLSLEEITNLLILGQSHCSEVQELAEGKMISVRAKINDLCRLEQVLEDLIIQCRTNPDNTACPIVESLQPDPDLYLRRT
ncbi:MAG: Hg(II)-responsive transcriptional regulator [Pseudomonadota bacterium]|nr:Hg(II)-responsive transcriptional regulator [Pseudomonadota bacterium]|tara:strand:- start:222 stop:632 length:411 start_codon:yes stop_codon:yes gene_type:complete